MAYTLRRFPARYFGLMAMAPLIWSVCFSSALAEEQTSLASDAPALPSRSGEPLTDFETMELHYRRYTTAANTMAQLFKQLNQKIQEVALAAKTADAKNNSHNRRLLEDKLRQLESARTSTSHQYAQLQSQMQNEYRSYTAISNDLKARYDTPKDSNTSQETAKELNPKSPKVKDPITRDPKAK
ncbi:MAG: hypothetical protein M3Q16_01975 [Pseudomonadota bacterium]|nr:hypothetical protein [Pseudomonadota bacterium]